MHNGAVTDRYVITDMHTRFFISAMNDHTILYVNPVPDMDTVHVPSYHGIEPDAAVIAHRNVPHDSGIWCDKTMLSEAGGFSFNR
jgi:hypothetical protein